MKRFLESVILTAGALLAPMASAATLTFSGTDAGGAYGYTAGKAWLIRPGSSDLDTFSAVSVSGNPGGCTLADDVCGFIRLQNKSPGQTGIKRDAQNHYFVVDFADGAFAAQIYITVNEGDEFATCATASYYCPDKITAKWILSGPAGATFSVNHPDGYKITGANPWTVNQGAWATFRAVKTDFDTASAARMFTAEAIPAAVPLPAALPLAGAGLAALGLIRARRKRG